MLEILKKLLGINSSENYKELLNKGAVVLDVRTRSEFQLGHLKGTINIPVDVLSSHLPAIDKNKVIITCCASGMRSAKAKSILEINGFTNVHNIGSWHTLKNI